MIHHFDAGDHPLSAIIPIWATGGGPYHTATAQQVHSNGTTAQSRAARSTVHLLAHTEQNQTGRRDLFCTQGVLSSPQVCATPCAGQTWPLQVHSAETGAESNITMRPGKVGFARTHDPPCKEVLFAGPPGYWHAPSVQKWLAHALNGGGGGGRSCSTRARGSRTAGLPRSWMAQPPVRPALPPTFAFRFLCRSTMGSTAPLPLPRCLHLLPAGQGNARTR